MLFRLVLNTLEAEAGNYWQTRFVWPAQCFKQFWIYCQHCTNWDISFLFKCSLFLENWKLKELEKPATWQHYRAGAGQQLLSGTYSRDLPRGHQPASPIRSPASPLQAFASAIPASRNEGKSQSLCASVFLVLTKILTSKIVSYLRGVKKEIRECLQIT